MWLKLFGLVVPLGLDTFAVAAALGMGGVRGRDRIRVTLLFTGFEVGMPLIGAVLGSVVGRTIGGAANYVAIAIVIALGTYTLLPRQEREDAQRPGLPARTYGVAAIGLGVSISLDELAIGFTLGLLGFPLPLVLLLIGVQTLVVTQAGLRLGAHVGERIRQGAERLAGLALVLLGLGLLAERLSHGG